MANNYLGLARGPIDHAASSVINAISNGTIEMGSAVVLGAVVTAELLPRVIQTTGITDVPYGIAVGGDTDGIYATDGAAASDDTTRATNGAGLGVVIVTQGRCLARVDATVTAIGDKLVASATAGILKKASAITETIIATALQASGSANDIIAVDVQREGLNT